MRSLAFVLAIALSASACSRGDAYEMAAGTDVTVQKKDGVKVEGRLVEVKSDQVIVEDRQGVKTTVARAQIAEMRAAAPVEKAAATPVSTTGERAPSAPPAPSAPAPPPPSTDAAATSPTAAAATRSSADPAAVREVTLPAGTELPLTLRTAVSSDKSNVEDQVRATLRRAVTIKGVEALPAGTVVLGHITDAQRSARVKGRATVAFRFTRVDLPGEGGTTNIRTGTVSRTAPGTKKRDAATIGGGAVGGAIVGGIIGGGDGAAKGAAIGGAGGTGVVLATRGKEVTMAAGTPLSVKLTQPLTVRVRTR